MRALCISAILLAGCGTMRPEQVTVPCLKSVPVKPEYRFGSGAKPSSQEAVRMLALDFEAADKYGSEWEAAAAGCVVLMKTDYKEKAP